MSDAVTELLRGAADLHYHAGPSPFPRKMGLAEAAKMYNDAGFSAVVMKSHHHSMVMDILALKPVFLDQLQIKVFSGVALNGQVGGLNPRAVELCLRMGGKIVWFPTMAAEAHIKYHQVHHDTGFPTPEVPLMDEEEIDVLDAEGNVKPEVHEIIRLIKETDAILSFGHMAAHQISKVLASAKAVGVERFVISHPDFVQGITHEEAKAFAREGVFIEHVMGMYNDQTPKIRWPIARLVKWINYVGPEQTTLASDVGQRNNPTGIDTYRRVVQLLLESGVPERDISRMVVHNPRHLLGFD